MNPASGNFLVAKLPRIANGSHHPQPGLHCLWCQYRTECKTWLPGMD